MHYCILICLFYVFDCLFFAVLYHSVWQSVFYMVCFMVCVYLSVLQLYMCMVTMSGILEMLMLMITCFFVVLTLVFTVSVLCNIFSTSVFIVSFTRLIFVVVVLVVIAFCSVVYLCQYYFILLIFVILHFLHAWVLFNGAIYVTAVDAARTPGGTVRWHSGLYIVLYMQYINLLLQKCTTESQLLVCLITSNISAHCELHHTLWIKYRNSFHVLNSVKT